MLKNDYSFIKTVLIVIIGILSYWCLNNLSAIFGVVSKLISVIMPFIVGFVIAYILNIPMKKFESILEKKIQDKPKMVRMICSIDSQNYKRRLAACFHNFLILQRLYLIYYLL